MDDVSELVCRELIELVTDYLEGALSSGEAARCEDHLAECEECRIYVDQMRRTLVMLGRLVAEAVPAPARDDLLAEFRRLRAVSRAAQPRDRIARHRSLNPWSTAQKKL